MGKQWMKFGKIDRDRFFSVSGPRICKYLQKIIKKTIKINDFWILAGFWGITMDSENHGSWSHRKVLRWVRRDAKFQLHNRVYS